MKRLSRKLKKKQTQRKVKKQPVVNIIRKFKPTTRKKKKQIPNKIVPNQPKKGECRLICLQSTLDSTIFDRVQQKFVEKVISTGNWKIIDKQLYKNLTGRQVYLRHKKTGQVIGMKASRSYKYLKGDWEYCSKEIHRTYTNSIYIAPAKDNGGKLNRIIAQQDKENSLRRKANMKAKQKEQYKHSSSKKRRNIRNNKSHHLENKPKYQKQVKITTEEKLKREENYKARNQKYLIRLENKKSKKVKIFDSKIKDRFLEKEAKFKEYMKQRNEYYENKKKRNGTKENS